MDGSRSVYPVSSFRFIMDSDTQTSVLSNSTTQRRVHPYLRPKGLVDSVSSFLSPVGSPTNATVVGKISRTGLV